MVDLPAVILSVFAAFIFGTYFVPLKKTKNVDPYHYQFFVGISVLIISTIALFVLNIPFEINTVGILTGILWATANLLTANALKYVGVSKVPIAQGIVVLVSFIWGLVFLQELFQSVLLAVAGIALLIVGMPLIAVGEDKTKDLIKGAILLVLAGLIWGTMFAIPLAFKMEMKSIILSMAIGIFFFGIGSLLFRRGKLELQTAYNSLFSGTLWSIGNVANILAVGLVGLAIAGPLAQLAILFGVGWGLFYFKEVKSTGKMVKIIIGGIMLVLGAILLAFSK